jgi:hypothetical protein
MDPKSLAVIVLEVPLNPVMVASNVVPSDA